MQSYIKNEYTYRPLFIEKLDINRQFTWGVHLLSDWKGGWGLVGWWVGGLGVGVVRVCVCVCVCVWGGGGGGGGYQLLIVTWDMRYDLFAHTLQSPGQWVKVNIIYGYGIRVIYLSVHVKIISVALEQS